MQVLKLEPSYEGQADFADSMRVVAEAHDELLKRLFGEIPEDVGSMVVSKEKYTEVMKEIQREYGLVEGNPDLMLFVFEQLSRSPQFEEGDGL